MFSVLLLYSCLVLIHCFYLCIYGLSIVIRYCSPLYADAKLSMIFFMMFVVQSKSFSDQIRAFDVFSETACRFWLVCKHSTYCSMDTFLWTISLHKMFLTGGFGESIVVSTFDIHNGPHCALHGCSHYISVNIKQR